MGTITKRLPDSEGLFRFYWRTVLQPYAWKASCLAALMLVAAIVQTAAVALAVPALEVVSSGANSGSWIIEYYRGGLRATGMEPTTNVVILAIVLSSSLLFVLYSGITLANAYYAASIGHSIKRVTKQKLFDYVLSARYETVLNRGRGAILHDLADPPVAVQLSVMRLSTLLASVFNSIVLLTLMLYLSWWATAFVGIFALTAVHGTRRLTETKAREAGKTIYSMQSREAQLSVDAVDGLKISKVHGLEGTLSRQLGELLQTEVKPALRMAVFRHLPSFINEFAAGAIVMVLCATTLLVPALGLSFPILVAFLVAIRQCGSSIAFVSSAMVELEGLRPRISIVDEMAGKMPREESGAGKITAVSSLGLQDLSFSYASRGAILKNVSFRMDKGTVTAVVGSTGSGKSTIANLIVGLYPPSSGSILVNGIDLKNLNLGEWRSRMGYVPQDPFLFNTSIRNNIALWDETVSLHEIERASQLAQLHDFVATLPEGYETSVGDHGLELSGGQAQRVAIARAILRKPEILIFDEATSALDNLTEKAVYSAISALRSTAIVLVIAHRLSTIRDADTIIVLADGKIVEYGTHETLMSEAGSYSKLYTAEATHT